MLAAFSGSNLARMLLLQRVGQLPRGVVEIRQRPVGRKGQHRIRIQSQKFGQGGRKIFPPANPPRGKRHPGLAQPALDHVHAAQVVVQNQNARFGIHEAGRRQRKKLTNQRIEITHPFLVGEGPLHQCNKRAPLIFTAMEHESTRRGVHKRTGPFTRTNGPTQKSKTHRKARHPNDGAKNSVSRPVTMFRKNGGLGGTRTLDQCLKRALLYQLSYQPVSEGREK